ncbi:MupA/Atu3671 family FMN-dependent luciferase-like monooxygenase [Rhodobacter ferrooxidans]|uniref:Amino acid adenylation domain protein n=1 Tax=Rhodobacter ferrooxidans TaxID=371731 RepID=C8RXJ5_9RHOB|nr:MupA/Atu3671 family FMN-dependent luciferase-like monooxygenase [Rhodobacter sp. SW2]EEW26720.1 amino acid adenylation domain protein [Rhodobacter sp. SW2]
MKPFSSIVIGNESLTIQCAEVLLARGHSIAALVSRNPEVQAWAQARGLRQEAPGQGLADRLAGLRVDWLLSIANLSLIPEAVLALAKGAVNFHDGPLPRYAGLNAPVWAILNGEVRHGITWHLIAGGVDEGDILEQRLFDIAPTDTALTLNTKCFAAAIESFPALLTALETGAPKRQVQDLSQRHLYARADRPAAAGLIDFSVPAAKVVALVRALDHGSYFNPLSTAKIRIGASVLHVGSAEAAAGTASPGTVLEATEAGLVVACGSGAVRLAGLRDAAGEKICPTTLAVSHLASPSVAEAAALTAALAAVVPGEAALRRVLLALDPAELPVSARSGPAVHARLPLALPRAMADDRRLALLALLALGLARLVGKTACDVAYGVGSPAAGILSTWVPLRVCTEGTLAEAEAAFAKARAVAQQTPAFALDLLLRDSRLHGLTQPPLAFGEDVHPGSVLTLTASALHYDSTRISDDEARAIAARLGQFVAAAASTGPATLVANLPILPDSERELVLEQWNRTAKPYERSLCVHQAFESQVSRTPDAIAVVFEAESLSYAALNARANRAAHVLMQMGVKPGTLVALCVPRGLDLLVGALAIQKAGGAYVPIDPAYPSDRIALYLQDSAAPVVVTHAAMAETLPPHDAQLLTLDADPRLAEALETNPASGVTSADLAYVIYTSGSTGRPKGVMIEHRNVINFFAGMDDRIDHAQGGVWLAVTSLSFDISVLELFWTLARGFKLVLTSDEDRALVSAGRISSAKKMDFSIYFWGNDDGAGPKKYELLLEGARFADNHGFCAVWTPERHFHAFGGPYPNPSVTGAAVAAVTKNIGVRAGSVVLPLHHPARVAEEWAVIDNLTNGRAGLGVAAGWHPNDFVLRPENSPPDNRSAMFAAIDQLRRLWRGETVDFPTKTGTFGVQTQPRPVSKELAVWVTIAGNPATWREAGEIGAHVLTHLLGQSIDEVADKIKIYHSALREAGHDPANFTVTLMLHTYVTRDREQARATAIGPMKAYLGAAAGLVKQYAWAFPAFKKPQGISDPADIDLRTLTGDEVTGILDFAFNRYFEDSGLFGTVEDALDRVEQLKRIGVTEVACLIDYGIAPELVLEGLFPLAEVLRRANAGEAVEAGDYSIAAQIIRHGVTHLQCTPSMARMLNMNEESRMALGHVKHLLLGGEALPGGLVADLQKATRASITNMYGPTETTIWSTCEAVKEADGPVSIGRAIANTRLYVLDAARQPVPVGSPGELWIGGDGVARGYWRRDDLTADAFRPDPFVPADHATPWGARMYKTGDLVRLRADGKLEFLGRSDHQVKLRGYRIELGEIEAALEAQPGVTQAAVLAREDTPGDLRLVAYLVGTATEASLRSGLGAALPAHMVPAHFVVLPAMPLTPNRKLDRKALPAPQAAMVTEAYQAPDLGIEAQIAAIWSRVLNVPKVGARDNFFALGGHSLLAVQVHREISQTLGLPKHSITDIFRYPVLSALAAHLGGGSKPAETPQAMADRADARADAMARRRALRSGKVEA